MYSKKGSMDHCRFDHTDCFAYSGGSCVCLSDTEFQKPDCPFYATREQAAEARAKAHDRLCAIGAQGLLQKYRGVVR